MRYPHEGPCGDTLSLSDTEAPTGSAAQSVPNLLAALRISFSNGFDLIFLEAVNIITLMLQHYQSRSCCVVNFIAPKFWFEIVSIWDSGALNTHESNPYEAGPLFGWIEPEMAQYPKSTSTIYVLAQGGPVPIRSSQERYWGRGGVDPCLKS